MRQDLADFDEMAPFVRSAIALLVLLRYDRSVHECYAIAGTFVHTLRQDLEERK
jgi:hypothetical protein